MKRSSLDKMNAAAQLDMLHLERIMKKLGMRIANGFMDELAETVARIRQQNSNEAWELFSSAMRIASELVRIKLEEKIEAEYLSRATADDADLKDWTKYAAMYFINEMEYERPITDKLDKAIEEQVYDAMTKQLGYE